MYTGLSKANLMAGLAIHVMGLALAINSGSANAQTSAKDNEGLHEIIVTAQRREQKLQDVPIAITTLSGDLAERSGVQGTETLTIAVPGLQFSRQIAAGGAPFLRGVGNTSAAQGFEPPVAIYIDDVYIGSPGAALLAFNNVSQIEVLKGPQGTLFGRNATGGVINIRTASPSSTPEMNAKSDMAIMIHWMPAFTVLPL
tara:strand:- start:819 stop:1415 length:597 start_codon:yes stop_codon:yes gene_type:complete